MKGSGSGDSWPLPPPRPKSPPEYPDLYGKRRGLVNVQTMEREIGFLEEELKSVESLQPASRACKEVVDFVSGNADPLIPVTKKTRRSCSLSFGFWKWLCESSCFNLSWICCCGCYPHLEVPHCSDCNLCTCKPCSNCSRLPKCHFCSCSDIQCFNECICSQICKFLSCSFSCRKCTCCCRKCSDVNICNWCTEIRCCCCCSCF
ncbi:guanine nucleotide-binding subunit gamma 3-like [Olea europaea subsp. europaea]|uniref:Guanine nucleotide-binding subunit gamma 3-like n=1 Tax=Olea europaea subsp. europaea TaxID=158383 RepID=A0A8S0Q3X5_OLEEU|nr:guanine nucleotide-binding subunit gamma 3-like [Olea europaea subsp. europaea]